MTKDQRRKMKDCSLVHGEMRRTHHPLSTIGSLPATLRWMPCSLNPDSKASYCDDSDSDSDQSLPLTQPFHSFGLRCDGETVVIAPIHLGREAQEL